MFRFFVLRPGDFYDFKLHIEKLFTMQISQSARRFWISTPFYCSLFYSRFGPEHKRLQLNCSNTELLLVAVTQNLNKISVYASDLCW